MLGRWTNKAIEWLVDRTRKQVAWSAVAVVALAIVVGALVLAVHMHADFGNVPGWISALGTLGTGIGLILAWRSFLYTQRTRTDDEAIPARLVKASFVLHREENTAGVVQLVVSTPPGNAITQVDVVHLAVHGDKFNLHTTQPSSRYRQGNSDDPGARDMVDDKHPLIYNWELPQDRGWTVADVQRANANISFTDKNGRRFGIDTRNPTRPLRYF